MQDFSSWGITFLLPAVTCLLNPKNTQSPVRSKHKEMLSFWKVKSYFLGYFSIYSAMLTILATSLEDSAPHQKIPHHPWGEPTFPMK